jgi:hypothetical protein
MHAENGFLKVFPNYKMEASFSHPFSVNEFEFGELTKTENGFTWTLKADKESCFQRPEGVVSSKKVCFIERRFTLEGNKLSYELDLGIDPNVTGGKLHLTCSMTKSD